MAVGVPARLYIIFILNSAILGGVVEKSSRKGKKRRKIIYRHRGNFHDG
jgi:hypothetical protein